MNNFRILLSEKENAAFSLRDKSDVIYVIDGQNVAKVFPGILVSSGGF